MVDVIKDIKESDILIVDDITSNLAVLTSMIIRAGYHARPVTSAKQAQEAIRYRLPDLILLDIAMPGVDGFEFCTLLKETQATKNIPIIFISALGSKDDKIKAFQLGAVDFIMKPFEIEEVTQRISTHLKSRFMAQQLEEYNKKLHVLIQEQNRKIMQEQKQLVLAVSQLTELREDPSRIHVSNLAYNAKAFAGYLKLHSHYKDEIDAFFVENIELAARIHDIGKKGIIDRILLKASKLDMDEREVIKSHSENGANILKSIYSENQSNEYLPMCIDVAYYHHEKWDGSGYPKGLRENQIPLAARIVGLLDTFDILLSERSYKEAYSMQDSLDIVNEEAGVSFDPEIVKVFNRIVNELRTP